MPMLCQLIFLRSGPRQSWGFPTAIASAEVAEILGDFAEMSRAGVDDEDTADPTQADFALAELKEYVRVSVQIVFEQLADRREATARDAH